jgi:SAM-dependent methyltransferase
MKLMQRFRQLKNIASRDGGLIAAEAAAFWLAESTLGISRAVYAQAKLTDSLFDLFHGSDTGGLIPLKSLGLDETAGRRYAGTPPRIFRKMLGHLPIRPSEFIFVDLGCGKGRALMLAAEMNFRRTIGVDLSPELLGFAKSNTKGAAELVLTNCANFVFPVEPMVVFMANPFWDDVMAQVVSNLERSLASHPREVYVAYYWPIIRRLFDRSQVFRLLRESDARYPWYVIYQSAW